MADPHPGAYVSVEETKPRLLADMTERLLNPEFGAATIEVFEQEERTIFGSYSGKYVQTGALMASLTERGAAGAIRELRPGGFTFGTSIWYARFQGTTGKGNHRPPSAILKASALEAAAAAHDLREYIMHGRQAGLV